MTRINVVPVETLKFDHLLGEYKEITRVFTLTKNYFTKHKILPKITTYRLGTDHVKFFYTRLPWILQRYEDIIWELEKRKVNLNYTLIRQIRASALQLIEDTSAFQQLNWEPAHEDIYLNMARLAKQSKIPQVLDELKTG